MKLIHISSFVVLSSVALVACERRDNRTDTSRRDEPVVTPKYDEPAGTPKNDDLTNKSGSDKVGSDKLGEPGPMGPIGGGPTTGGEREHARDRLAAARCDHYKTCNDIAKDKKYDTYDSCMTREKADIDKDWKIDDCSRIDNERLQACVAAVTGKKCDKLFSTSPSECAESKVCIKK